MRPEVYARLNIAGDQSPSVACGKARPERRISRRRWTVRCTGVRAPLPHSPPKCQPPRALLRLSYASHATHHLYVGHRRRRGICARRGIRAHPAELPPGRTLSAVNIIPDVAARALALLSKPAGTVERACGRRHGMECRDVAGCCCRAAAAQTQARLGREVGASAPAIPPPRCERTHAPTIGRSAHVVILDRSSLLRALSAPFCPPLATGASAPAKAKADCRPHLSRRRRVFPDRVRALPLRSRRRALRARGGPLGRGRIHGALRLRTGARARHRALPRGRARGRRGRLHARHARGRVWPDARRRRQRHEPCVSGRRRQARNRGRRGTGAEGRRGKGQRKREGLAKDRFYKFQVHAER
jgi:hypothetical protein